MKNLLLIFAVLLQYSVSAQTAMDCNNDSPAYMTKYRTPQHWDPNEVNRPIKTIRINFIMGNNPNNGGAPNVLDTPANRAKFQILADSVNKRISYPSPKGFTYNADANGNICDVNGDIHDTKIRIELQDVYFYNNSEDMSLSTSNHQLRLETLHADHPETRDDLNIFFGDGTVDSTYGAEAESYISSIHTPGIRHNMILSTIFNTVGGITNQNSIGSTTHEIGHCLGVDHNYDSDYSSDEPLDTGHFDFLADVFSVCQIEDLVSINYPLFSNCPNGPCPYYPGTNIDDIYLIHPQYYHHKYNTTGGLPLMGGASNSDGRNNYISKLQAGRFHRNLSLFENSFVGDTRAMHRYVKEEESFIFEYLVTENEVWDFGMKMYQDIIIMPGKTLEITCELQMPINGKIHVSPGGKLIINGGHITCAHEGEQWAGIYVNGQNHLPQSPNYQGVLEVKNNALIEHANVAVRLYRVIADHTTTGGYVIAENSTFLNNKKSIEMVNYLWPHNLTNIAHKSKFTNLEFIWDDDLRAIDPLNHVTMYKVHRVKFTGCDFKDDRTSPPSAWLDGQHVRQCGIFSIDANYQIQKGSNSDSCRFSNLDFGVLALNANNDRKVDVRWSVFTDNLTGVELRGIPDPKVSYNRFNFTNSSNYDVSEGKYGIHLVSTTGIQVKRDTFISETQGNQSTGILSTHLGENTEKIDNNYFKELTFGNYAQGKNRNINSVVPNASGNFGLHYDCNKNVDNGRDFAVLGQLNGISEDYYGIRNKMGTSALPSGNTFTQLTSAHYDFINWSDNNIDYFYEDGVTSEIPVEIVGDVVYYDVDNDKICVGDDIVGFILPDFVGKFNSSSIALSASEASYDSLVDGGDTEGLITTVSNMTTSNNTQVQQDLASISPFLTEAVIKTALDKPITIFPFAWQYDLVMANIDVVKNHGFINYLQTKAEPLPANYIQAIETYAASGVITSRQVLESEMTYHGQMRTEAANAIISYYKNDSVLDLDTIRHWINLKNEPLAKARIIDTYLQQNDYVSALQTVNDLSTNISTYPTHLQAELSDIVSFKTFMIGVLETNVYLGNLTTAQVSFLTTMANAGNGRANIQAQNILCFFYGDCKTYTNGLGLQTESVAIEKDAEEGTLLADVSIYPNPANSFVAIELPLANTGAKIQVFGLDGKLVFETQMQKPIYIWDTSSIPTGTYIVNIELNNEKMAKKVVITK